jgi:hypothetical protein
MKGKRHSRRQAGVQEIEITEEMIEAGQDFYWDWAWRNEWSLLILFGAF